MDQSKERQNEENKIHMVLVNVPGRSLFGRMFDEPCMNECCAPFVSLFGLVAESVPIQASDHRL